MKSLLPPLVAMLVITALCFGYTQSMIGQNLGIVEEITELQFELSKLDSKLPEDRLTVSRSDILVRQEMGSLQRIRHIQIHQVPVIHKVCPLAESLSWDNQGLTVKTARPKEAWRALEETRAVASVRADKNTLEATWLP